MFPTWSRALGYLMAMAVLSATLVAAMMGFLWVAGRALGFAPD